MKREKAIPAAVFGLIFILALGIWNYILIGKNNQGVSETSQASLPVLTINTGGEEINELHGIYRVRGRIFDERFHHAHEGG